VVKVNVPVSLRYLLGDDSRVVVQGIDIVESGRVAMENLAGVVVVVVLLVVSTTMNRY
jgi:hypothetical protein